MSYYTITFNELINNGVPRWYIRLHLINILIYSSKINIYCNPYDIETEHGWYATTETCISIATAADLNRKCYGELKNFGFPSWDEYSTLYDGDEYDSEVEYKIAYDRHKEEWLEENEKERRKDLFKLSRLAKLYQTMRKEITYAKPTSDRSQ